MIKRTQSLLEKSKQGKKALKIKTSIQALTAWTKGAVHGPGDIEYDKYAYEDFKKMGVNLAG